MCYEYCDEINKLNPSSFSLVEDNTTLEVYKPRYEWKDFRKKEMEKEREDSYLTHRSQRDVVHRDVALVRVPQLGLEHEAEGAVGGDQGDHFLPAGLVIAAPWRRHPTPSGFFCMER